MKIQSIKIRNYAGARKVDLRLSRPINLLCGKNGAGKSSIMEAVRHAMTGRSTRVDLKKQFMELVTEGEDGGFVSITMSGGEASVVLPGGARSATGDGIDGEALQFVFSAANFSNLNADDRRKFLFSLMGLRTDGAAVKDRLTARGCDAKKVEHIAPFLRAGFDAGQKEAQGKAREAKGGWKTMTGGETYGSVKAATWKADKPQVDTARLEDAVADLVKMDDTISAETARLGEIEGRARQAKEQAAKLASLRQQASLYARIQDKLYKDEAELRQWEEKVAETKAKATGAAAEAPMTCPHCAGLVVHRTNMIGGELQPYEAPPSVRDPEAVAKLPEYEKALALYQSSVANGKRDLAAADVAANAIRELEAAGLIEAPANEEVAALRSRLETLRHDKKNQEAGIRMLEEQDRRAADADEKTRRAAALHQDVQQWDTIAGALAPDGIPGEMLAEAMGPINERLLTSSATAEWSRIVIHSDMRITMGLRDYSLLSESERWRADAMIAEAIAFLSGVRLLVLDRFDVLDMMGREDLLYWLDALVEDSEIDSALIFGTLKSLPAKLPETVEAFWIENGAAGQLQQAALVRQQVPGASGTGDAGQAGSGVVMNRPTCAPVWVGHNAQVTGASPALMAKRPVD